MTDTVNVPREWLEEMAGYLGATGRNDWSGLKSDDAMRGSYCVRVGALMELRAMLAAAPKAEPDYRKLVRDVDRMHEDGTIPPEAPQAEPVTDHYKLERLPDGVVVAYERHHYRFHPLQSEKPAVPQRQKRSMAEAKRIRRVG